MSCSSAAPARKRGRSKGRRCARWVTSWPASPAPTARAVIGDRLLEIFQLLARDETDLLQRGEVLLGLRQLVHEQISLADVLVGAAMPGVEPQRFAVMLERVVEA